MCQCGSNIQIPASKVIGMTQIAIAQIKSEREALWPEYITRFRASRNWWRSQGMFWLKDLSDDEIKDEITSDAIANWKYYPEEHGTYAIADFYDLLAASNRLPPESLVSMSVDCFNKLQRYCDAAVRKTLPAGIG